MKNPFIYFIRYPTYSITLKHPTQFSDAVIILKRAEIQIENASSKYASISVQQPSLDRAIRTLRSKGIECE